MSDKKRKKPKKEKAEKSSVEPSLNVGTAIRLKRVIAHRAFAAVLLCLVSFAVFIPSIHDGLVWDDIRHVQELAPRINSYGINIQMFFPRAVKEGGTGKYFRPGYSASLALDNKIWGVSPSGFHLTNIILHSVTTVLLYYLILLLFREFGKEWGDKIAFLSSLLFAVYPLHVESVSFIAARGDILAATFFFLCMIFYLLSFRKYWLILLAGICLYLSFISKEVAFSFPIIILGFDVISRRILGRRNLLKYVVVGVPVIFYFLLRFGSYTNFANLLSGTDLGEVQGTVHAGDFVNIFFNTYLFYMKKLLFPYNLNPFIGTIPGGDALHLVLAVLLIAGVCVAFFISIKKKENITAFGLLWIFATLGPAVMIAIYPLAITRFAERFLYLPSAGYCMLVGYLIVNAGQRSKTRWLTWAAGGLLCASFAVVTVKGQEVWKDSLTFWENAVRKSPDQIVPKMNYGAALRNSGRTDEAILQYSKALSPEFESSNRGKAMAANGLGVAYVDKGDYSNAEKFFKQALEFNPAYAAQYNYQMGFVSLRKNDTVSAEGYLQKAVELNPRDEKAHYLLGVAYFVEAEGENSALKYRLAEKSLERSLKISPRFSNARILLARIYLALGKKEKARHQAKIALEAATEPSVASEARSILNMN